MRATGWREIKADLRGFPRSSPRVAAYRSGGVETEQTSGEDGGNLAQALAFGEFADVATVGGGDV